MKEVQSWDCVIYYALIAGYEINDGGTYDLATPEEVHKFLHHFVFCIFLLSSQIGMLENG